jgi:hypothetical protein
MAQPLGTITSANAVYYLSIQSVFPTPQRLEGWGVNDAFSTDLVDLAEIQLGVDGFTASGWLPRLTPQTLTFIAASPSITIFETWQQAQDLTQSIFYATGTIILPAIQRQYTLPNGTLMRYQALANARRVLEPRPFHITWGYPITAAPAQPITTVP